MENLDNRVTAEKCRSLVEQSKIENIYDKIANKARIGKNRIFVPYVSPLAFRILIQDGYRIFAGEGTIELTEYDRDITDLIKEYEISWEN